MLDRDGGVVRGARGPGIATRDLDNNFFFFLSFPSFCWLIVLFLPLCVDLGSFFLGNDLQRLRD